MRPSLLDEIRSLSVDEKLEVYEALSKELGPTPDWEPTPEQQKEIGQIIAEYEANPDDLIDGKLVMEQGRRLIEKYKR